MIKIDSPQQLTKKTLERMVGKHIHVKRNMLNVSAEETVNAWFAGGVAGIEEVTIYVDPATLRWFDEPVIQYGILLTDGTVYKLSSTDLLIEEITAEDLDELVKQESAKQEARDKIIRLS